MAEKITLYDVDINFEQAVKDTQELKRKTEELKNIADSYKGTVEENSAAHIKAQAAYKASTAELRSQENVLVKLTAANDTQAGTLKKLEAANAKLRLEQKGLNLETEEGITRNKQITEQINKNTDAIKANSDKRIQDIMNVGNYKSAFDGLGDTLGNLPGPLGQASKGFKGVGTAMKALLANPIALFITAIVGAVAALISIFKKFDPIVDKIQQGLAAIRAVLTTLKESFIGFITGTKSLSETFNGLGAAMNNAAKEAVDLKKKEQELDDMNWLLIESEAKKKRQIDELLLQSKDRTKSEEERIALIDEALKIEEEAYKERKAIADREYELALGKITTGRRLTEEEIQQLKDVGVQAAINLKDTKDISDEEIQLFAEAVANREKVLNDSITIREKAINRQNVLLEKQAEEEAKALEAKQKAESEAENEKIKAEQKKVEKASKALDKTLKLLGIEIETYKLKNQSKIDNETELTPLLIEEELKRQEAINAIKDKQLKLQLDNGLITQEEYNLRQLEQDTALSTLRDELEATYLEETIKLLGIELETYKLNNQSKIDGATELTQALIDEELLRQESINAIEDEQLKLQLDNGLITQEEYGLRQLEQDIALRELREQLETEYNDQKNALDAERALFEHENAMAVLEGNLFAELDLKKKMLDDEYKNEMLYAEKIGANTLNIEKKYNKAKRQLAISEFNAKMTIAQQLTNNLAQIAGEQTAIGKAAAVASATISTIQGGVSALTGMIEAIPGPVGIVLGAVAAAAVLASGYLQVKEILSVKSGLPGDGGVSASIPSASMPSVGGDTQAAIRSTVNPEIGQGIVSRETNDTASQSVSNGVSQALQENPMQPTLVTDEVTVNQSTQMAQSKTATI